MATPLHEITSGPVLIVGHRGACARYPENTLPSIEAAYAEGADGIECDVRLTADGALVVLHDALVERTTDGEGDVRTLTLGEVRALDAGYRFGADAGYPFRGQGLRVPTLEEVLEVAAGRLIILELKGTPFDPGYDPTEPAALALGVALQGRTDGIVVSSFNPLALAVLKGVAPELTTAVLTPAAIDPASNIAAAVEGGHAQCHVQDPAVDAPVVEAAHVAGKTLLAWTVNEPARVAELARMGADAVITDDPVVALRAAGR